MDLARRSCGLLLLAAVLLAACEQPAPTPPVDPPTAATAPSPDTPAIAARPSPTPSPAQGPDLEPEPEPSGVEDEPPTRVFRRERHPTFSHLRETRYTQEIVAPPRPGAPWLVLGGRQDAESGTVRAGVWTSDDTTVWTVVPEPAFGVDDGLDTTVYDGTVWSGGYILLGATTRADRGGRSAVVWYSTDGRTWERTADPDGVLGAADDQQLLDVAEGPDGLVAVGTRGAALAGAVWRSDREGDEWRLVTDDAFRDASPTAVAAGPAGLVAVGTRTTGGETRATVWTSDVGDRWRRSDAALPAAAEPSAIAALPDRYVVVGAIDVGGATAAAAWTSHDGRVWTQAAGDGFARAGQDGTPTDVAATDVDAQPGRLLAVGESAGAGTPVWSSTDGTSWVEEPVPSLLAAAPGGRLEAVGLAADGAVVAVGGAASPLVYSRSAADGLWRDTAAGSPDLGPPAPFGQYRWAEGAAADPRGAVVVSGVIQEVATNAPDGVGWLRDRSRGWRLAQGHVPDRGFGAVQDVVAAGAGVVAAGYVYGREVEDGLDAVVGTSTDRVGWQRRSADPAVFGGPGDQVVDGLAVRGQAVVAVGLDGGAQGSARAGLWVSGDGGVGWERLALPPELADGVELRSACGGPVRFVAVGDRGPADARGAVVLVSEDGRTWRQELVPGLDRAGVDLQGCAVVDGAELVVGGADVVGARTSRAWLRRDGGAWAEVPAGAALAAAAGLDAVAGDRDRFVVAGRSPSRLAPVVAEVGPDGQTRAVPLPVGESSVTPVFVEALDLVGEELYLLGGDGLAAMVWVGERP